MILLFDPRKKLLFFLDVKFEVSYYHRVFLVLCVLFSNFSGDVVLGERVETRETLPPLLFLSETGRENFTKFPVISSGEIIQRNKVPENIRGSLSSLCEKCSESQRKKVEQILLLLFNFNSQGEGEDVEIDDDGQVVVRGIKTDDGNEPRNKQEKFSSRTPNTTTSTFNIISGSVSDKSKYRKNTLVPKKKVKKTGLPHQGLHVLRHDDDYHHLQKKKTFQESYKSSKFKVTSVPKSSPLIPTPEIQYYQGHGFDRGGGGVIQLPTLSTTPSSSSSVSPHSFAFLPYYYPSTESSHHRNSQPTLPFPASISTISTTMSSALDPVQSVEMPTPPMPPTTSGPIYLYYLSSTNSADRKAATATVSSSMQPPTTPVVESSVASKPTTIEP